LPQYVRISDLWGGLCCGNFHDEVFGVIRAYIDESHEGAKVPGFFTLSCSLATGGDWEFIEAAWRWVLQKKNEELIAAGRKPIRRYHAVDCFNREEEFKGWSRDERDVFVKQLFKILESFPTSHISLTVSAQDIQEVWPEKTDNPLHFAYYILLRLIMLAIGKEQGELLMFGKVSMIYERCGEFGESLLKAFNHMKDDSEFEYRHVFTTIAPMGWEDCIQLQPADMVAYEAFHDSKQRYFWKDRKKSLDALDAMLNFRHIASDVHKKDLLMTRRLRERQLEEEQAAAI
jgi:hypothetical protein